MGIIHGNFVHSNSINKCVTIYILTVIEKCVLFTHIKHAFVHKLITSSHHYHAQIESSSRPKRPRKPRANPSHADDVPFQPELTSPDLTAMIGHEDADHTTHLDDDGQLVEELYLALTDGT